MARPQSDIEAGREQLIDLVMAMIDERGSAALTVAEVAARANMSPANLYRYFDSKEAIYAALLSESLDRLHAEVAAARAPKGQPQRLLAERANAWFGFYSHNPRDLDLGFYLVQGLAPRGLNPELDRALNQRLMDALRPCEQALEDLGLPSDLALQENAALFAHGVGLLLLQHTGRIRLFGQSAPYLFQQYVDRLIERVMPQAAGPAAQPDLFAG